MFVTKRYLPIDARGSVPTAPGFVASMAKSFSIVSKLVEPASSPKKISYSGEHQVSYSSAHSSLLGSAPPTA